MPSKRRGTVSRICLIQLVHCSGDNTKFPNIAYVLSTTVCAISTPHINVRRSLFDYDDHYTVHAQVKGDLMSSLICTSVSRRFRLRNSIGCIFGFSSPSFTPCTCAVGNPNQLHIRGRDDHIWTASDSGSDAERWVGSQMRKSVKFVFFLECAILLASLPWAAFKIRHRCDHSAPSCLPVIRATRNRFFCFHEEGERETRLFVYQNVDLIMEHRCSRHEPIQIDLSQVE